MSPAQIARRTVNVASSPSLGIWRRSNRCARHRPIQPAPSTVDAIATVADWRVVAIQCKRNANTIVLRKPPTVHSRPARCAPSRDRSAPAYAARMTGRSERIISAYSCSARIAETRASAVGRVHDLGPPTVVERDPEIEGAVPLGLAFERSHALLQRGGRTVAAADEARAHSLTHEVGQLALDGLSEDLHQ